MSASGFLILICGAGAGIHTYIFSGSLLSQTLRGDSFKGISDALRNLASGGAISSILKMSLIED
jgi:hypothetical protein